MKKRHYFSIVIFSYLLFLIVTVPASLVTNIINENAPVEIQGASGTIWNGKANLISINDIAHLNETEWNFLAWKIFTGHAAFQISTHFDDQKIVGEIGVSFLKQFFVNNFSAKITSEKVAELADIPLVQLSGMITLDIEHAHWKMDELPLASGDITWNSATITVAETVSLGNLNIALNENGDHLLNADIKNQGGDIRVSGNAELVAEKNYAINIKLSPTSTASDNIAKSLSLFAQRQSNGDFLLKKTGQLDQLGLQ